MQVRWVWLLSALLLAGCVTPAHLQRVSEVQPARQTVLASGDGLLSPERSKAILDDIAKESGARDMLLRHVAVEEAINDAPLVIGNSVALLRDGPGTYAAMYRAIRQAKDHVNLEVYVLEADEIGRQLADLLLQRQQEGIQINVIYDSIGSINTSPDFFARLRAAGARVLEFNPINPAKGRSSYVIDHRDHRKILIVDGATAFTGGINFSSVYSGGSFGGPRRVTGKDAVPWRDTQVEIRGPVVADFQRLFFDTWKKQNAEPVPPRNYFPHLDAVGKHIVRAVGSTPDDKVSTIQTTLLSAIIYAEHTIHITNAYFVPDPAITRALKRAAKRGVDVKLILPGVSDFWAVMAAARSHYGELIEAGVKIYERKEALLHAKTVVIDSVWSTVGSTNLDRRSLLNDEADAIVLSDDFADQMEAMFRDDLAQSRLVELSEWQRRGAGERMKEFGARLVERWL